MPNKTTSTPEAEILPPEPVAEEQSFSAAERESLLVQLTTAIEHANSNRQQLEQAVEAIDTLRRQVSVLRDAHTAKVNEGLDKEVEMGRLREQVQQLREQLSMYSQAPGQVYQ